MSSSIKNYSGWKVNRYQTVSYKDEVEYRWLFRQDVDTEKWDYILVCMDDRSVDDKSQKEFNTYEECLVYARSGEDGGYTYGDDPDERDDPKEITDTDNSWGEGRGMENRYHDANPTDYKYDGVNEGVNVAEIRRLRSEDNKRFCEDCDAEDMDTRDQMALVLLKEYRRIQDKVKTVSTKKEKLDEVVQDVKWLGFEDFKSAKWSVELFLRDEIKKIQIVLKQKDCRWKEKWEEKIAFMKKELAILEKVPEF